ncbi:PAS domain S-box protein [Phycisphaerales bacterium AB-hyl4]|uniref:Oxygen sensor histidine kinase NreB n=1 Tax=Natronomicrosphaera hydrolytica TaxID=3242702 RepID=A0ABV4U2T5_9BACT
MQQQTALHVSTLEDPHTLRDLVESDPAQIATVVVGAPVENPLQWTQRLHRLDRSLSVVILAESSTINALQKALQFTPFLGEDVRCVNGEQPGTVAELVVEAAERRQRRQRFAQTAAVMNQSLSKAIAPPQIANHFSRLLDQAPIGVVTVDHQGGIYGWNRHAQQLLGASERHSLGQPLARLFASPEREQVQQYLEEAVRASALITGRTFDRSLIKGLPQFLELSAMAVEVAPGRAGAIVLLQDVTAREQALRQRDHHEEALRQQRRWFEATVMSIGDAIIATDEHGHITLMNNVAEQLTGWSLKEAVGLDSRQVFRIVNETHRKEVESPVTRVLREGRVVGLANHTILLSKDGREVPIDDSGAPIRDSHGHLVGTVLVFRDISRQRQAQRALKESEQRYRQLFESIDEAFCVLELLFDDQHKPIDYRFVEANPAFEKHTGIINGVGKTAREIIPNLEEHWIEIYGRVAVTGQATRFTQGSEAMGRWFNVYAFRVGDPQERKVALLFTDITQQKRAEQEGERLFREVQLEQERLAEIFQYAPSFMCIVHGPDHVFERANEWYQQLVGKRELIGRAVRDVFPDLAGQGFFELLDHVYKTGETYVGQDMRVVLQRESGEIEQRWLDFVYQPLRDADGTITGIFTQGVDLTERKKAEDALRESERQQRARAEEFKALMDAVPAVVFVAHDPEGKRITGSRYAHEFLRLPPDANLSKTADAPQRPAHFRVCKGGVELPGEQLPVQRAARGEPVSEDEIEVHFDDGTVRHLLGNATPLYDEHGQVRGALAAMVDITQRKQAEQQLQRLNQTLEQRVAERTAEVERRVSQLRAMAAELSRVEQRERRRLAEILHDNLQQLLAAGRMQLSMLVGRIEEPKLRDSLRHVEDLLAQSIETSRSLTAELSPRILYEGTLADAIKWLARWMRDNYELHVELKINESISPADEQLRVMVFQSVRELLFNAAKHSGVHQAEVYLDRADEKYLQIRVADRGRGFDQDVVFESHHDDSGFGLFNVRERVELLDGKMTVDSQPEKGTTITLLLPLQPTEVETP